MKYFITIAERTHEVEVTPDGVRIDGRKHDAELRAVAGSAVHHLLLDGASHVLVAENGEQAGNWNIHLNGQRIAAEVVDERTRAIRQMTGRSAGPRGPRPVKAPMPGLIVRIEVAVGDRVKAGQGVAIIEAMKMENELKAESDGVVSRIAVSAGSAVEKGAVLIEFESAAAA